MRGIVLAAVIAASGAQAKAQNCQSVPFATIVGTYPAKAGGNVSGIIIWGVTVIRQSHPADYMSLTTRAYGQTSGGVMQTINNPMLGTTYDQTVDTTQWPNGTSIYFLAYAAYKKGSQSCVTQNGDMPIPVYVQN